jgi:hypothetical protein
VTTDPIPDVPPTIGSVSVDAGRKLWFDYVAKLNDRNLDEKHKAGATSWVLLGIAAAMLYKSVPLIPGFLAVQDNLRIAVPIFFLELEVAILLLFAFAGLALYPLKRQRRILPERLRRLRLLQNYAVIVVWAPLVGWQLYIGIRFVGPRFVRDVLIGYGLFWAANLVYSVFKKFRKHRKTKTTKLQIPEFYGLEFGEDWGPLLLFLFNFPLALLPTFALLDYLWSLNRSAVNWVTPLGAASQFLVFSGIVSTLFGRLLHAGEQSAYLELEQAIVVENLSPPDAAMRFVTQMLGTEVGDWLSGVVASLREADEKLKQASNNYRAEYAEIESVEDVRERRDRAQRLTNKLTKTISDHQAAVQQFVSQLSEYAKTSGLSAKEHEMLKGIIDQFKASAKDAAGHYLGTTETLSKLRPMLTVDS